VLQAEGRGLTIVFIRTKRTCQKVADDLTDRGFAVAAVHGDLGQGAREQALRAFRSGKVDVLVATDVAARGIDIDDVTHVVNYSCPEDEKMYLHRIGRTGRAGKDGVAVTLVDWDDVARWKMINRALGLAFHDPVETYSTSEHVHTGLGIRQESTGRLPKAAQTRAGLDAEAVEDLGETGRGGRGGGGKSRSGGGGKGRGGSQSREHGGKSNSRTRRGSDVRKSPVPASDSEKSDDSSGKAKSGRRQRQRRRTRGGSAGGPASGNETSAGSSGEGGSSGAADSVES
jgi:superfamily II DNA/RNA helicase